MTEGPQSPDRDASAKDPGEIPGEDIENLAEELERPASGDLPSLAVRRPILTIVANLLADITVALVDPRIRLA